MRVDAVTATTKTKIMNTKNLEKLIDILDKVPTANFNMGSVRNSERKCIIGHLITMKYPDTNLNSITIEETYKIAEDFTDITMGSNAYAYLFSGMWRHQNTNTIDHAIFRINSLLEGYEPEHITAEVQKELQSLSF